MTRLERLLGKYRQSVEFARAAARTSLTLAERVELAALLIEDDGVEEAASCLGLSPRHVENLSRIYRNLGESARRALIKEGKKASLRRWLRVAALTEDQQRDILGVR
jgi:hypothetical protein